MGYSCSFNRVEIREDLSSEEAYEIKYNESVKYIQISSEISRHTLELMNNVILRNREDIQFRVYGFRNVKCDLKFLEVLADLTDLNIGEIEKVENIEAIGKLSKLKKLRVSLNKLNDISFLQNVSPGLTELMIGTEQNNSKVNLAVIVRFQNLETLFLYKINHGFEELTELKSLKQLTINASKIDNFDFLKKTIVEDLSLGMLGCSDYSSLYGNSKIKKLELWKLRSLKNLNLLCNLPSLEYAKMCQLSNITSIPDLRKCSKIKTLVLDDLKNLTNISELAFIPHIENIEFYRAKSIDTADVENILKNPSLKKFKCGTGSLKKDHQIEELIEKYNKCVPVPPELKRTGEIKKRRLKLGEIYEIPLPNGKRAYGRLFKENTLAIYDQICDNITELPENEEYRFFVCVYDDLLRDGIWPVAGNRSFASAEDAWPPPKCVVDAITGVGSLYYKGEIKKCTHEECKDLEVVSVWDRRHVVDRIMGIDT